jgi:hypothetical protein
MEWICREKDASRGFIVEKWSCRGVAHQESLHTGGIYEVGGEVPERSLGEIILNGPLTLSR